MSEHPATWTVSTHDMAEIPTATSALRRETWVGLTLALVSLSLGIVWATTTRPLNAPDEPAYLQAVMQVRKQAALPEIHFDFTRNPAGEVVGTPGDAAARQYMTALGLVDPVQRIAYENVQPPLYFLVAGVLTRLVRPEPAVVLYAGRLVSALFGAGVVYFCWAATRQLAPCAPRWAVAVGAVIALLPEFCFISARVGNDSLANCLGAAAFYVWFRGLRDPRYDRAMGRAGTVVGLAILAKLTAVVLLPGLALVVVFRAFQGGPGARAARALRRGAWLAMGAGGSLVAVCGWWFVRNLIVYGEPSGTAAANRFWTLNLPGFDWRDPAARWDFARATWLSFWGYFGWQTIPLPDVFYRQASWLSLLMTVASVLAAARVVARHRRQRTPLPAHVWQATLVMGLTTVLLLALFVQFSVTVAAQAQGRYLYLALLPAALLFTGGLSAWARGPVVKWIALGLPILWLATMNGAGLARVP